MMELAPPGGDVGGTEESMDWTASEEWGTRGHQDVRLPYGN